MIRGTYSPEGDTLGVDFEGVRGHGDVRTVEIAPGVLVDLDEKGRLLGLEVLRASQHYPAEWLRSLGDPATWLTLKEAAAESEAEGDPISAEQLRWLLNEKKLEGRKVGRDWQVAQHELWNYLENRPGAGRPSGSGGSTPTAGRFSDVAGPRTLAASTLKKQKGKKKDRDRRGDVKTSGGIHQIYGKSSKDSVRAKSDRTKRK